MNWHPHTQRPELDAPASGLIAVRADDEEPFVLGMYIWRFGCWWSEDAEAKAPAEHWWISEDELTEGLR